jgi:hypothetical protein
MPPAQPTTVHAAGAPVYLLTHVAPSEMIAACALRPWTQIVVNELGGNSATFGTYASGSLSVPVQGAEKNPGWLTGRAKFAPSLSGHNLVC